MSQIIFTNTYAAPPLQMNEILRYMRCKDDAAEISELIRGCLDEILPQLVYKVCWQEFEITEEPLPTNHRLLSERNSCFSRLNLGFTITDSLAIRRNLKDCNKLILFAATVGLAPDRLIARYGRLSPTKALCFQAIGAERIESLCDLFCEEIAEKYAEQGFAPKPRYSPGYGDFSLSMQQDVFRALDCHRKIGLSLNDSLLMSPSKSVTALIGLEPANAKHTSPNNNLYACSESHNCKKCDKADCFFRQI